MRIWTTGNVWRGGGWGGHSKKREKREQKVASQRVCTAMVSTTDVEALRYRARCLAQRARRLGLGFGVEWIRGQEDEGEGSSLGSWSRR